MKIRKSGILKRIAIGLGVTLTVLLLALGSFTVIPVFAQTYLATLIPGQPLSDIAAVQIITNSGLPIETLQGGVTNNLTRGRDYVNAYRYAHQQLYTRGWYRGISEDHTPLLKAMVEAIKSEGYTTTYLTFEYQKTDILQKFWYASDTQNAKELGYSSLEDFNSAVATLSASKNQTDKNLAASLQAQFDAKWH